MPGWQEKLLERKEQDILLGGPPGSGKSIGMLLKWHQHAEQERRYGMIVASTESASDLLIESFKPILFQCGYTYRKVARVFVHPRTKSVLFMRNVDSRWFWDNFTVNNFSFIGVDDLNHFDEATLTRLRVNASPRCTQFVSTARPGGTQHAAIRTNWIESSLPMTPFMGYGGLQKIYIPTALDGKLDELDGIDWLVEAWLHGEWIDVSSADGRETAT